MSKKLFSGKRGQTFNLKRGTPIGTPAGAKLRYIAYHTAKKNCVWQARSANRHIKKHGCIEPCDAIAQELHDLRGNISHFYHLWIKVRSTLALVKENVFPLKTEEQAQWWDIQRHVAEYLLTKLSKVMSLSTQEPHEKLNALFWNKNLRLSQYSRSERLARSVE